MYFWRVLEDVIVVVPTAICGVNPVFLGGSKGVTGAVVLYHVLLLDPPRIPLSPTPRRDSMDS